MMKKLIGLIRMVCMMTGLMALVMIILAFTSAPFWIWYGMGTKNAGIHRPPDYIVLLGGGGMPSESGLIRTWYTAQVGNYFTRSKIIIALPGDTADSASSINGMKNELILRGIAPDRILMEDSGTNTRAQAMKIFQLLTEQPKSQKSEIKSHKKTTGKGTEIRIHQQVPGTSELSIVNYQLSILIVTSPEHLHRAVLTFKKAGFIRVDGLPAFEQAIESDITFNASKLGGRKFIPDIGNSITLRYQFWTQLHYEELILREWMALLYYKLSGWI